MKHRPCACFSKGPLSPIWHLKVTLWAPKSDLWATFLALLVHLGASLAPLWPQSARTKATWDWSHNLTKNIEKPGSQNEGAAARGGVWGPGKSADSEKSIAKHWGKR